MTADKLCEPTPPLLGTVEPTSSQRRLILAFGAGLVISFGVAAPFAAFPLTGLNPVAAVVSSLFFLSDLITAVLLFSQFSIIRSRALLVLASGYLFASVLAVVIGLTYPGLFAPTGLLGAGLQTASWLYLTWHLNFAMAVLGYTLWRDSGRAVSPGSVKSAIAWSIATTSILVFALVLLFTAGNDYVPRLAFDDTTLTPLGVYLGIFTTLLLAGAFTLLWIRRRSVLDQWLLVAVLAILLETLMSNVLAPARYTVGFYFGIALLLFNATVLMVILLAEATRLYARIVRSHAALQRERQNKLINLDAMVAALSHEVRQPLGAILANAECAGLALGRPQPDLGLATEALNDIESDVRRTSEIFKGIGSLFRRSDQTLGPVDVNDVAAEVLRTMRSEMEEHGIQARAYLAPDLPPITGHRGQLLEVVVNLVSNAIDAMRDVEGRERLMTIESRTGKNGAAILIVRDTGQGLSGKTEELFDAFVTTKPRGMGLGLAICRRIIERHGGQILATPAKDQMGAVFEVVLPVRPQPFDSL